MEPNLNNINNNTNLNFTQDTDELFNRESQNSPQQGRERPNRENFFLADENNNKKMIDDGITMIIEYVMQEKMCPNIMPYQEKLMAYLKEKIESQVKMKKIRI